jgi:hypothetical protein
VGADQKLNCRKASRLLSLSRERPLDDAESAALKRHLDACLMCRNFEGQLRFLEEAARRFREGP